MASKTSFQAVVRYGFEVILANLSLLAFSCFLGGIMSLWLGEIVSSNIGLISSMGAFVFFTSLTYILFLPALIYKILADGVAKGLELQDLGNKTPDNLENKNSNKKDVENLDGTKQENEKSSTDIDSIQAIHIKGIIVGSFVLVIIFILQALLNL